MSNVSEYTSNLKYKENQIIKEQKDIIKEVERLTGNEVINQTEYLINSFSIDAGINYEHQDMTLDIGVSTKFSEKDNI